MNDVSVITISDSDDSDSDYLLLRERLDVYNRNLGKDDEGNFRSEERMQKGIGIEQYDDEIKWLQTL